jgi:tripartite-type tricarboxylate transporter receptor subunit TctC
MKSTLARALLQSCCLFTGLSLAVQAADVRNYPTRPVRIIVPSPAGSGGGDLYARLIGRKLAEQWGQQVIVDNRPGAGMSLGAIVAAKSPADGYTLFVAHPNAMTVGAVLRVKQPYDPIKDFAPITMLMAAPSMFVVHPSSAINSVGDLLAAARRRPGELSFGTSGLGSVGHLIGELLSQTTKVKFLHVPYKGSQPALLDLVAGRIDMVSSALASQITLVRDGKLKAIATTGLKRARLTPTVPTVAESGVPGFDVTAWYGVAAPANTPTAIINKLNKEIQQTMLMPEVQEPMLLEGGEFSPTTPQQFATIIQNELAKWAQVVKIAGIKPE